MTTILVASIVVTICFYLKKGKIRLKCNYYCSMFPIWYVAIGILPIAVVIYALSLANEPANTKEKVALIFVSIMPLLGEIMIYFMFLYTVDIYSDEKFFVYRDFRLRKHFVKVSECQWYEKHGTEFSIALKDKIVNLSLDGAEYEMDRLLRKNNIEKLECILEYGKKGRASRVEYCKRSIYHFVNNNQITIKMSKKYIFVGIMVVPGIIFMQCIDYMRLFLGQASLTNILTLAVFTTLQILTIWAVVLMSRTLFWYIVIKPNEDWFILKASAIRKYKLYYRDCEWYSVDKAHVKLKTPHGIEKFRRDDIKRLDALVMMLIINGVNEK